MLKKKKKKKNDGVKISFSIKLADIPIFAPNFNSSIKIELNTA